MSEISRTPHNVAAARDSVARSPSKSVHGNQLGVREENFDHRSPFVSLQDTD